MMKNGQRNSSRVEPRKFGSAVIIVVMLLSLCFLTFMKARYCSAPHGRRKSSEEQLLFNAEMGGDSAEEEQGTGGDKGEQSRKTQEQDGDERPICDESSRRSVTCDADGDVRVVGSAQTVYSDIMQEEYRIRPYARKHDSVALSFVKEWTLKPFDGSPPACTVRQSVPAVIFSNGGFTGNLFHDYTDVLFPLFVTSFQFHGEVQFLVSGLKSWWVNKFILILNQLTNYEIIDIDNDGGEVRCFPRAIVGVTFHKEMGVDASRTPTGYSVSDFQQMLRRAFGLERSTAAAISSGVRPKLLIISRKNSRRFMNEKAMVDTAVALGFDVTTAEPDMNTDMATFALTVNSADVMIGVHGAGLTNMVFLPRGAVLIQVVPYGGLEWLTRVTFKDPSGDMGIQYMDYNLDLHESTLIEQYPEGHPVLVDPPAIHRQGWEQLKTIYLDKQNVRLNLAKFGGVLQEALKLLPRS